MSESDESSRPPEPESGPDGAPPPGEAPPSDPSPSDPPPSDAPPAADRPRETNKDAKTFGMLAHLSGVLAIAIGLPFAGPLLIWLIKKDEHAFVDDQGKEALNFQILMMVVYIVLFGLTICTMGIGALLYIPVGLVAVVMNILAAIQANDGVWYRYPFNWRVIK